MMTSKGGQVGSSFSSTAMKLFLTVLSLVTPAAAVVHEYDICVFGGTSGGVAAAVQAARMGRTVILAEPGRHLGGMTSGGLAFEKGVAA
jgi:ribulose 1,5-bisphosphate synthetase/thiazole synthase